MSVSEQWEKLLTPKVMQERLITASLYMTAYELLRESIIGRLRSLYINGFDENGEIVGEEYHSKILARNKSPLYASLEWLIEANVIDSADLQVFERIRSARNLLAHELPSLVLEGADLKITERFSELVGLLNKIEVWWVINFEIPLNEDLSDKDIDEKGVVPGPVLMIQMMLEVISGNEELLQEYQKNRAAEK